MPTAPDLRIQDLLKIQHPIIQAPMAGAMDSQMVIAVSQAGGLGSLPCAMLTADQIRSELETIRRQTSNPINLNFFCHQPPAFDEAREREWKQRLSNYYRELGLDPEAPLPRAARAPFDNAACDLVEEYKPEVVSFHFGLPDKILLVRVKATGAKILSSATTVEEARWLEANGCDAIIAQGSEAGGHRGMFLTADISTQIGTMSLVPQIVDSVKVPVIAAGGIADTRGIIASFALGASAVQLGTAYLFCPEAKIAQVYRDALKKAQETAITNVFTGRPARGIVNRIVRELGPMSDLAPQFPQAASAIAPLRKRSEAIGSEDFAQMWSGQSASLGRELPASELTQLLATNLLQSPSR
jgi:nitronate monooxygenase